MHRAKIEPVQALRAVAALSIAILHVLHEAIGLDPSGTVERWHNALPWDSGVDLFFVISGFVMVYASNDLFGRRNAPALFITRRLIRIVPLYWAATTLFLLMALTTSDAVSETTGGIGNILMSYAFLPSRRPDGGIQPIYSLGWTLNYEMFFYVVFAAFIWQLRHRALILVALTLAAAIAVHRLVPAEATALVFWTDPIMAEFLFGMVIAALASAGIGWSFRVSAGLALVAVLWLVVGYVSGVGGSRPVVVGLPMALLVAAAVFGGALRLPRALPLLGDASFALYLVHPFSMRVVRLLWQGLHLTGPAAAVAYVAVALLLAVAASVAVHLLFERPVGGWLRARLVDLQARRAPLPHGAA